jgi:hypothetical protein
VSIDLLVGVAAGVVVLAIGWFGRWLWLTRSQRVSVQLENHEHKETIFHVKNGARPVRIREYGLGGQTDRGYEDVPLHDETLVAAGHRQESVISLPAYAEERFFPVVSIGSRLLPRGVKAIDNKMRVRPFVRIDGRQKPYHGDWCVYDLQKRRAE